MSTNTILIFKNAHYSACVMDDGSLIVTKNGKRNGRRLTGPKALEYSEAIETAIDPQEAHALCRVLFN